MMHRFSIPAENSLHVAEVLAELWKGHVVPFPPNLNSYMILAGGDYNTAIEVYPLGSDSEAKEGYRQATFIDNLPDSSFTANNATISIPASEEQIFQVAHREGWRALRRNKDNLFDVIELWVENRLLLELLPQAFNSQYLSSMKPENLRQFLAAVF